MLVEQVGSETGDARLAWSCFVWHRVIFFAASAWLVLMRKIEGQNAASKPEDKGKSNVAVSLRGKEQMRCSVVT